MLFFRKSLRWEDIILKFGMIKVVFLINKRADRLKQKIASKLIAVTRQIFFAFAYEIIKQRNAM